ncbi:MAG: hypothetical protein KGM24_09700, partial [Elusimicrobia bacterium]|nr:hypothetical protein [Elusimicrobiota bacterium]
VAGASAAPARARAASPMSGAAAPALTDLGMGAPPAPSSPSIVKGMVSNLGKSGVGMYVGLGGLAIAGAGMALSAPVWIGVGVVAAVGGLGYAGYHYWQSLKQPFGAVSDALSDALKPKR